MEMWDVYDKDRCPTGRTHLRGTPLAPGDYHMSVHIAIFSTDGRLLIQQRTSDRASWPDMWDITAAGSVISGESSAMGAHRELYEELGLDVDFTDVRPRMTVNYTDGFGDYYLITMDVDISSLTLQKTEVQAVRFVTLDEALQLVREGRFIPYYESFLAFLFDLRKRYSTHNT